MINTFHKMIGNDPKNIGNYLLLADYYELQDKIDEVNYLKELIKWIPIAFPNNNNPCGEIPMFGIDKLLELAEKVQLFYFAAHFIHELGFSPYPKLKYYLDRNNDCKIESYYLASVTKEDFKYYKELDLKVTSNIILTYLFLCKQTGLSPYWFASYNDEEED